MHRVLDDRSSTLEKYSRPQNYPEIYKRSQGYARMHIWLVDILSGHSCVNFRDYTVVYGDFALLAESTGSVLLGGDYYCLAGDGCE